MSTRKNVKLKRFIALAVNLQLAIAPMAYAQNGEGFQKAAQAIGTVGNVGMQAMQMMQQQQMQQMAQQQAAMMQQQYGLSPVDPSQIPPVLSQNGCLVLPARPNYPVDKCESYDATQAESGYYTALMSVAQNNHNDLQNFLTAGHERFTTQGIGCYEKALKQFTAALNSRVEALNKLEAAIEQEVANFQKLAEKDVLDLKKGNALLEGKPAKFLKDVKFEDKFNDPQCRSFLEGGDFRKLGKAGLRGILEGISSTVQKPQGKSGLTAAKFKGQQNQIKEEVKKIAKKIATHVQKRKTFDVKPGSLGIRSKYFGSNNSTLAAILTEASTDALNEVQLLQQDLGKSVEDDPDLQKMIKGIETDTIDLDNALYVYERKSKNSCLNGYLKTNFGGVEGLTSKLQDPNISAKANRESDNALKNEMIAILSDNNKTIDEKMALIKKAESRKGNDRWTFTTGKSVSIEGKTIGASTRLRASDMISIFTDNCTQKFEKERNSKGRSTRSALNMIKNYKTKYNNLQKSFASKIQDKVISEMINCPNEKTEGSGAASCTGALNMDSGNFCLRTANTCAGNMMACQDKANKIVETTRAEQKVIAQRYKANMDQFKAKLSQTFMATNKIMESTARQLDGMYQFGSTYNVPMNLDLSLITDKMMKEDGIDPSLMIEDPEAYKKAVKKNIAELKKSVKDQNNFILNGKGNAEGMVGASGAGGAAKYQGLAGEVRKYIENYQEQEGEWATIAKNCEGLIDQHNNALAEQEAQEAKAAGEYNEKVANICKKVQGYNSNPAGFCGEAAELGDEIFEISAVAGDSAAAANLKEFDQTCDSYNSESTDNTIDPTFFGKSGNRSIASATTPESFCKEFGTEASIHSICSSYTSFHEDFGTEQCSAVEALAEVVNNRKEDDKNGEKGMVYPIMKVTQGTVGNEVSKYYVTRPECISKRDKLTDVGAENEHCKPVSLSELDKDDKKTLAENTADENMKDAKCYDLDTLAENNSRTIDKYEKSLEQINEYIAQGKRAKQYGSMGGLSVSFCNANYGGQFGGKDFMNTMGEQPDRGLAGSGGFAY